MKKILYHPLLAIVLVPMFLLIGCGGGSEPLAPENEQGIQLFAKKGSVPAVDVVPVFRIPTGRNAERLTVFVFHEKGGKGGGKPPKDNGGGEGCSDPNTNQTFSEIGVRWLEGGILVEYQPAFEPEAVVGAAFGAVVRAFDAWEFAVTNEIMVNFSENASAPLPPERDGRNIIGWRQLVGRDARKVLAATYIWDDGNGTILEADIVYNTAHKWAVNTIIESGGAECGTDFDVQAIGTHEIGHFIGLNHVNNDDATMAPTAAKGELKKQTLTPGDITGANAVAPGSPTS